MLVGLEPMASREETIQDAVHLLRPVDRKREAVRCSFHLGDAISCCVGVKGIGSKLALSFLI